VTANKPNPLPEASRISTEHAYPVAAFGNEAIGVRRVRCCHNFQKARL
jgi:hypothetical protein